MQKNTHKKQKNPAYKKFNLIFWLAYSIGFFLVILFFSAITLGWLGYMPTFEELENPKSNLATEVWSSDQVLLGKYYIENRSYIHYIDLDENVVNALVSTEDERFYTHSGIDFRALARVVFKTILGGNSSAGGGSTISQQLAKNLFKMRGKEEGASAKNVALAKFKEWVIAVELEKNYSKDEIIAMYLNTVDFGSTAFGIKSAAKTFYDQTTDSLTVNQSAMLVGLLKAPTKYSPVINPENAFGRRNVVLSQMKKNDKITNEQYDSLSACPVDMSEYQVQTHTQGLAKYFREYIRVYLKGWCDLHTKPNGDPYNIYKDGLKVYTTVNSKMQLYAEEAVEEHLGGYLQPLFFKHWEGNYPKAPYYGVDEDRIESIMNTAMRNTDRYRALVKREASESEILEIFNTPVKTQVFSWNGPIDTVISPIDSIRYTKYFLQAGFMAMEPTTGYVKAYVGGIDYNFFKYDHVKVGKRQVGSTFKPFVYATAISMLNYSPCHKVPNVPVRFELENGQIWEPKNSGNFKDGEMIPLKQALANSINYISAYLIKRTGPEAVVQLAKSMGVRSNIEAVPAICLGVSDLSVYEMVGASNTYVNKGVYIEPILITRIEDKNGNVIQEFVPNTNEALSEEVAYVVLDLMQGVVSGGTGTRLRGHPYNFRGQIAGKTGTTDDQSDGWFIGMTPNLVGGVWVGCEDRDAHFRTITHGQGASMALPIWGIFMKKVYEDGTLGVTQDDVFDKPTEEMTIELNCSKYQQEENEDGIDDINNF